MPFVDSRRHRRTPAQEPAADLVVIARRAAALADLLRSSGRPGEALVAANIADALRASLRRVA
jgi:hypothetical protein